MSAYKMDHPFVVSFSGGRTSGFMLHQILQANGGIPDGSHVCFANTGKEHEATLQFVQEIADTWQVKIAWIERRFDTERGFDVTNF